MSATVEVVCYKSKVLANNESPLMLRVTKDRKLKYSSIGVSVNPLQPYRKRLQRFATSFYGSAPNPAANAGRSCGPLQNNPGNVDFHK